MEFFGLTSFGVTDPIKFLMRPDYVEPKEPPNLVKRIEKGDYKHPFNEVIRNLDVYSGILDGYSYDSYHRLRYSRDKGYCKPIGPRDMYRDSITGSIDFGWFLNDPALENKTWYKNDSYWPKQWSDTTRYLENARKTVKNFQL